MIHVILFEDNPDASPDIRATHMPLHLAFLERHAGEIHYAGPLFGKDGESQGGLWVTDVPDSERAESLVHEDPFWETGLRKSYRILKWKQVFANGARQI